MKNYYSILQIPVSAKPSEIRKAYRKRALELHPDVNKNSTAENDFIELNEAYSVLKNALSRVKYDKLLEIVANKKINTTPESKPVSRREQRYRDRVKRRAQFASSKKTRQKQYQKATKKKSNFGSILRGIGDILLIIVEAIASISS